VSKASLIDECSNYVAGRCIGAAMHLHVDRAPAQRATESTTCLARRGYRCSHFERAVLPLAELRGDLAGTDAAYRRRSFTTDPKSASADVKAHPFWISGPKPVTDISSEDRCCADCGEPRPRGSRYCHSCALKRKRDSARRRAAKHRRNRDAE